MEGNKVLMPTEDTFIVSLGKDWDNSSSNSNVQKVEIFTSEITESESGPNKLNPLMVVDLPVSFYSAVIEKWTSLPNPPVEIYPHYMVTALRRSQNQIIVSTFLAFNAIKFFTYDIRSGFWANLDLDPPVRRLLGGGCSASENGGPLVDDYLYWVKYDDDRDFIDLVVDSYSLHNNQWFEGRLNMYQEIFGKREYLSKEYGSCPRLIHIGDHKFCLNLQSSNYKRRMRFLYNVVLSISPLSDSKEEVTDSEEEVMGFEQKAFLLPDLKKKLSVSVHSIKKYQIDHDMQILDTLLWKQ